jgi:histone-lysine N-methyltransferase SETMAR
MFHFLVEDNMFLRVNSLLSSGVMLLQDNARPHAASRTQAMLQEFGWEVFDHPAYSPDLATSDFHLFPKLKEFLGGRRFKSDEEVKDAAKEWLNGLAAEVYDEGIQKLVTRYDKCLNVGGDYVQK